MRKLVKLFRLPRRVYSKYQNIWVPSFAVGDVKTSCFKDFKEKIATQKQLALYYPRLIKTLALVSFAK